MPVGRGDVAGNEGYRGSHGRVYCPRNYYGRDIPMELLRLGAMAGAAALVMTGVPAVATAGPASCDTRTNNTVNKLLECVTVDGVREHQAALQAIADANNGIRTSGTSGYDASAAYVVERLEAAGYDVSVQEFQFQTFIELSPTVLEQMSPPPVGPVPTNIMSYSGSGDVTAPVSTLSAGRSPGCDAADFAGFPAGTIASDQPGGVHVRAQGDQRVQRRRGRGGHLQQHPGHAERHPGQRVHPRHPGHQRHPGRGPAQLALPGAVRAGHAAEDRHVPRDATTSNVLAETPGGDPTNVVMAGAHLDSVNAGPGIQDNGSGSAALIEVAEQMAKVNPRNKVRFAWWGAEESGLVGSTYYVDNLTQEQQDAVTLYLNFDMIGSPNHVFFIYDGDDSDGVGAGPGPDGSKQIEKTFETYFDRVGQPFKGTDFSGRSDYGPFIAVGIPSGGLFTGAEGIKTPEEAAIWGGTAGEQYDPCYHLACDTFDNINLTALDVNSDAVAYAVLQYAMNTQDINGQRGKGNFKPDPHDHADELSVA